MKLSQDQNAAYLKLLKRVKKESQRQREKHPFYTRERFLVNIHPKRDNDNVTPKIARVAKDVVRQIKKTHNRKDRKMGRRKKSARDPARLRRGRLLFYAYNVGVKRLGKRVKTPLCQREDRSSHRAVHW